MLLFLYNKIRIAINPKPENINMYEKNRLKMIIYV